MAAGWLKPIYFKQTTMFLLIFSIALVEERLISPQQTEVTKFEKALPLPRSRELYLQGEGRVVP